MNTIIRILSVFAVIILSAAELLAQVPPPNNTPTNVPIDGGVFTLIGASVAYGAKKIYDRKKAGKE